MRVTTLDPDGAGSLREAVGRRGPRLVVFDVGGAIDLGGRSLVVREPHLTIAGQTAPDPGVTLIRGGLIVETHDVVVQHLAARPGDRAPGGPGGKGWDPDAMGVRRGTRGPVYNVVFDHCSATWGVDENLSVSGPADVTAGDGPEATAHDVTLHRCLVAEGLSRAGHPKGEHSKGTLLHDGVRNVSILGCLYAHNRERNPRLKGGARALIAGSVLYNWATGAVGMGAWGNRRRLEPAEAALVGNVAIAGPDTRAGALVKSLDPGARVFLLGNVILGPDGRPWPLADAGLELLREPPPWAPGHPASRPWETVEAALREAGARPSRRDPVDARVVRSVVQGEGRIIDSQEQVGGYPAPAAARRILAVPEGPAERRRFLDDLSARLAVDEGLDLGPLDRRLGGLRPPAR